MSVLTRAGAVVVPAIGLCLCATAVMSLAACSPASQKLVEQPRGKFEKVKDKGDTKMIFTPKVDILFVVDDSGSMLNHQDNLAANIQLYAEELDKNKILQYRVGVITTSTDTYAPGPGENGLLVGSPAVIERGTPNGVSVLAQNLKVGISGSGTEKFFEPVKSALTPPLVHNENAGFYRPEAFLALVFITDTDDQSSGVSSRQFYDFLTQLKGDKEKVLFYAAYIPSLDAKCNRSGEELPRRIEDLLFISGGKGFGLCDADFGAKLAGIGTDLVNRVGKRLLLSRPPDVSTIEVRYGNQVIPNDARLGWTYDPAQNALVFGDDVVFTDQGANTEVEVNFIAAEYPPPQEN
ncbi:MAG: VWA domain-containing protein [Bdellovibrionaceae bacterium]|nr:VWA domain-containing protein [Pseudobdellovibrionaceae bacterium]